MANLNNNKIKFDNAFIVIENAGEKTNENGQVDQYAFDGENDDGADVQKKTVRFLKKYEGKYIAPTVTFENETIAEKNGKMPAMSKSEYNYPYIDNDFYCNDLISYLYDPDGNVKRYNITKAAKLIKALQSFNHS